MLFKTQGFLCPNSARSDRVQALADRFLQALMSYDGCSNGELTAFCKSRGIVTKTTQAKEAELVQALEDADIDLRFEKFSDLPAELRVRIYKLHFDSLAGTGVGEQPPITRVSRLLRKEALPVFYDASNFRLSFGCLASTTPS